VARLVDEAHGSPVHDEGAKAVPHFHEAAIAPPSPNGAIGGNGASNGHEPRGADDVTAESGAGPITVPATPASALGSGRRPDAESWPPPPWPPPADPAAGTPEGPAAR
jgi:hypothetical protein